MKKSDQKYQEWLEEYQLKDCEEAREVYTTGKWYDRNGLLVIKLV